MLEARDRGVTVLLSSHILAETGGVVREGDHHPRGAHRRKARWSRCGTSAELLSKPSFPGIQELERIVHRISGVEDVVIPKAMSFARRSTAPGSAI